MFSGRLGFVPDNVLCLSQTKQCGKQRIASFNRHEVVGRPIEICAKSIPYHAAARLLLAAKAAAGRRNTHSAIFHAVETRIAVFLVRAW